MDCPLWVEKEKYNMNKEKNEKQRREEEKAAEEMFKTTRLWFA
jgi:hypothetical protein